MSNHHYNQNWKYAVWISKIRLLLLKLWAKTLFFKVIFDFPGQTGSRFSATTFFHHHFDQTWTYAVWISKIRLLVLRIWAKSLFPSTSRFSAATFFHHHYDQTLTFAVWISKIHLLVLRILVKSLFPPKPEVRFQRQHFSVITSIEPYHIPFEFRNSIQ